jgi:hypothetical protein
MNSAPRQPVASVALATGWRVVNHFEKHHFEKQLTTRLQMRPKRLKLSTALSEITREYS